MKWVEEQIAMWRMYKAENRSILPIPTDIQVGKALEHADGNVNLARHFLVLQLAQDSSISKSIYEPYWELALRRFDELHSNQIMMEDL